MLVLIKNNRVKTYPYSIGQFKKDNPKVSMRRNPPEERLNEWGIFKVARVTPPEISDTQKLVEQKPAFANGHWRQVWKIRAKKQSEIDAEEAAAEESHARLLQQREIKALFLQHNEIRALKGEKAHTRAEFKKWWRQNVK